MCAQYFVPEELKQQIIENEENAFGLVVHYLINAYGLSRSKAQQPANELINSIINAAKQANTDDEKSANIPNTQHQLFKINKEFLLSQLLQNEQFSILGESFISVFLDNLDQVIKEHKDISDIQTLTTIMYRKCIFNRAICNIEHLDVSLRDIVQQLMIEVSNLQVDESNYQEDLNFEEVSFAETILVNALTEQNNLSSKFASISHYPNSEGVLLFPSLYLMMNYIANYILDIRDRFDEIQENNSNENNIGLVDDFFVPPAVLPGFDDKKEDIKYANNMLFSSLFQELTLIANEQQHLSLFSKRKLIFGLTITGFFAQSLFKLNKLLAEESGTIPDQSIIDISTKHFRELFAFAKDLEASTKNKEIRLVCSRINALGNVLGYSINSIGEINFGENTTSKISSRELLNEFEKKGETNNYWKVILELIDKSTLGDVRLKGYITSVIHFLMIESTSTTEERKGLFTYINDIENLFSELISYKNLNRQYMIDNIDNFVNALKNSNRENLYYIIDNKCFALPTKSLIDFLEKSKEKDSNNKQSLEKMDLILLSLFLQKEDQIIPPNVVTITIDEYFDIIKDNFSSARLDNGLIFSYSNKLHFISTFEFMEFLLRLFNGEEFQELEVDLKYKSKFQLMEKPIIITIENIVNFLPSMSKRFKDFFEIKYFFMVGNVIELTHPDLLAKVSANDIREAIRNYSIYPGLGFIRISVVGKDHDAVYIPLNTLVLSYGMEALLSEFSLAGRIALEYGSQDRWVIKNILKDKLLINKIEVPSLLEIFKQQINIRKATYVENESLKRQLGKFAVYFREFIKGEKTIELQRDSFVIGVPEFPLDLLEAIKDEKNHYTFNIKSLAEVSSTVRLALENISGEKTVEELNGQIKKELEEIYTIRYFRKYEELCPTLTQLIDNDIRGFYSSNELIEKINRGYPELKAVQQILEQAQELSLDLSLEISSDGISFVTSYSLEDLINRFMNNTLIVPQAGSSWQLKGEMKIIFYKDITEKILKMLQEKVDDKLVYDIIVPLS